MARYRSSKNCFVQTIGSAGPRLVPAGEEFDVEADMPPSANWEAIDDEAKTVFAAHVAIHGEPVRSYMSAAKIFGGDRIKATQFSGGKAR